jgi:glucoamylase
MAKPGVLAAVRSSNAGPESPASAADAEQRVDSAILLAILDADLPGTSHNVCDQRAVATLDILAQAFTHAFPLNHALPAGHAPALGRSLADRYFGGNVWYVTTLAAAAFCFRRAMGKPADVAHWLARGDAWMATVQWMTPADGAMAEQVDRETKAPRSAQHLSWSYAAFISTVRLRQRALDQG